MTTSRAHDERETTAAGTGNRLAYLVLSFGLLAIVAYRSFVLGQASWDLLGLIVLAGVVEGGYELSRGTITRRTALSLVLTIVVALAVAVVVLLTLGT